MDRVSENGILNREEFARYKQRTVRSRFLHQIFLGAGGATMFGLVGVLTKTFLESAMSASAAGGAAATIGGGIAFGTISSVIGLAALAAVGIGCLYLGAKYMSQTILLDQDFQAKKIGRAARGISSEPAAAIPGMASRSADDEPAQASLPPAGDTLPQTKISAAVLQDRVAPLRAAAEKTALEKRPAAQGFVERAIDASNTMTDKARAL